MSHKLLDVTPALFESDAQVIKGVEHPSSLAQFSVPPGLDILAEEVPFDIDAYLLQKMETRIDAELGADAHNLETFGESTGWSFLENLAANSLREASQAHGKCADITLLGKLPSEPMYVSANIESLPIPPPPPLEPTVRIMNLPNHLMSKAMLEVTLEQANLDTCVRDVVTKPGALRGEVMLTLCSAEAADRCAQHFEGRHWDVSGVLVSAEILSRGVTHEPPKPAFQFSGEVPEFVPSFKFSLDAPVFLPVAGVKSFENASDASTRDEVSSCDED